MTHLWTLVSRPLGMILLGVLGMGIYQFSACEAKDLFFLHAARMANEAAAAPAHK